MNGILLVDKPKGWTSFDVVAKVRGVLQRQLTADNSQLKAPSQKVKVGHTGTLDPLATGLLVILIGDYTKKAQEFSKLDKTYEVTMKLGETSTTGDAEGTILPYVPPQENSRQSRSLPEASGASRRQDLRSSVNVPIRTSSSGAQSFLALHPDTNGKTTATTTQAQLKIVLDSFEGEILQTPPAYSAVKVSGKRAYKLAREGKEVKLEPRKVTVYNIKLGHKLDKNSAQGRTLRKGWYDYPFVKFTANVSSGTYIRSLVEDIGHKLGTGAYMSDLRRTEVGKFSLKNAQKIDKIDLEYLT